MLLCTHCTTLNYCITLRHNNTEAGSEGIEFLFYCSELIFVPPPPYILGESGN